MLPSADQTPAFTQMIGPVLTHTPPSVWAVLAALALLGARQMRPHELPRLRVLLMPVAMTLLSASSVLSAFGPQAGVAIAWAAGLAAVIAIGPRWAQPAAYRAERDSYSMPGSVAPLLAMLAVFAMRYAAEVAMALHHEWRAATGFSLAVAAGYGALSGLFAARARHMLRTPARAA